MDLCLGDLGLFSWTRGSISLDNWIFLSGIYREKIKNNKIKPKKQAEKGTFHFSKDLELYKDIINYDDTIEEFLKKVKEN